MKTLVALALASVVITTSAPSAMAQASASRAGACTPAGGLNFVCGLQSPEDLVLIPNTRLLVASGMAAGAGLHLIDTQAKTARPLPIAGTRPDPRYTRCGQRFDPGQAILHGLSLRARAGGGYTLYATNHGGHEAIEVFTIDGPGAPASATWIGCVAMPPMLAANSVAAFNDGTILATVLTLPGTTFEDSFAGRNTGAVFMWTPGADGFTRLAGTDLPSNNGVETSADDREFYVASSGAKRIVAYARADPSTPLRVAQLQEFAPDNVRMAGDRLIAAGMIDAEPACGGAPKTPADIQCPRGWIADAIDPRTMAVTEIGRGPRAAPYTGTATAIPVGDELWLSSFNSDRVAYRTTR